MGRSTWITTTRSFLSCFCSMKSKGFTLFEVLISVSLFLIVSGAIFTIVSAAIRTSATLTRHHLNSERLETLISFLRNVFTNLPPSAELSLQMREFSGGILVPELHFQHAPGMLPWRTGSSSAHVISLLPNTQAGTLAVKSYSASLSENERKRILLERTGWVHLLKDISQIQWKSFDTATNSFRKEWNFARPQLVKVTLWQKDRDSHNPVTAQFWIPAVQKLRTIE
ncbi:MAG: hypothetical protein C5B47_05830 [Verrucomicrobia bacterium]|nr:MAG: hypothetical protein C5B47_05830 [Verrucomicrobiota bacterium]